MRNTILADPDFFKKLDQQKNKVIYAKIISLTNDETPQEEITGKITSGSINVDGASAVRRTCSLTLVANDVKLNSFYWGLDTKFKVLIGVENNISTDYPKIIWFPQGIYVITSFSSAQSINTYTISISGKDKMCLLNGDVGGVLTNIQSVFDVDYNTQTSGLITEEKVPIRTIIYKLIHNLGGEKISNIIIRDLDDYGLELLEYSADLPLYIILNENNDIHQIDITGTTNVWVQDKKDAWNKMPLNKLAKLDKNKYSSFQFNNLSPISSRVGTKVKISSSGSVGAYTVAKKSQGETVGYKLTPITYAGELIGTAGETLTSVLDKIKKQLGDFEYFYDLEGRFVFQRVRSSFNIPWSPLNEMRTIDIRALLENHGFTADEINQIFNQDFSPIDDREDLQLSESEISDLKNLIKNKSTLITKDQFVLPKNYDTEISYNFEGNELVTSLNNSPNLLNVKNDFCIWGKRKTLTGLELDIHLRYAIDKKPKKYVTYNNKTYTTDSYDWREIIYRMAEDNLNNSQRSDFYAIIAQKNPNYKLGVTGYEAYYQDMLGFWRELYNPSPSDEEKSKYYTSKQKMKYWNKNVDKDPASLSFWIDFLDVQGELKKFSVPAIGRRTKVVKDDKVVSIYFKSVPLVIFYTDINDYGQKTGYSYFKVGQSTEQYFSVSSQGKSAQEELNALLYQHTQAQSSVSLSIIPIYYLEPNTKILIKDDCNLDINGEYNIAKFTIPLSHNGTMSITATKIIDPLE